MFVKMPDVLLCVPPFSSENIAHLAESALRFLELVQENNVNTEQDLSGEDAEETLHPNENYDSGTGALTSPGRTRRRRDRPAVCVCVCPELQALHEMVQQKVVTLLSDSENIVKQSLMENGITRLCVFFGRQKANDVLLSHMITFLNDKNDWHLRGAFFDSIVGKSLETSGLWWRSTCEEASKTTASSHRDGEAVRKRSGRRINPDQLIGSADRISHCVIKQDALTV